MSEKIEIIYDFNGYSDPKIKNVEVSRVNGYSTKIVKEGEKMTEEYKLKNISAEDARKVLKCLDCENVDIQKIIDFINKLKGGKNEMTDQTNDEKRYSEEVLKVNAFLEKNPKISYREAVLACLDRSEPETKEEFTEEEKQFIEKQKEDVKKVEEYLEEHPKVEYREAVKIVLNRDELNENEKKVEEYIEKRRSQGIEVSYREAVLAVLDKSESEPKKEE